MKKFFLAVAAAGLLLLSGCAEVAESDAVGLWYAQGQVDGNTFDHCIAPGSVDETAWNDTVTWIPTSLRTWNVAKEGGEAEGVDSNTPLVVTTKPDRGQTSGTEVNIYTQTNLLLNTWCGDDGKDASSPVVQWWQKIGKRYGADTVEGWRKMLGATVLPAQEKAKNVLRNYTADELVQGTVWADAQVAFAKEFSVELTRLSGGNFFCGPDFVRTSAACSSVAVSIKDVDYKDPKIQDARNDKQAAVERAQAAVADAQGKAAAAAAQNSLYQNEAWVQLELAKLELAKAQACAAAGNCTIILDGSGSGVQVHTK